MKYRTKIYLYIIGTSAIVLMIALSAVLYQVRKTIVGDLKSQVIAIAATAASNVDGDLVAQIKNSDDQNQSSYEQVRNYMRKVRDANRNERIHVRFIYTIYPDPSDPKKFLFGIDAEETQGDFSPPGSVDHVATEDDLKEHLTEEYSSGRFEQGQFGSWFTGYSPIYNSQGEYIGTMAVDISAEFVDQVIHRLYFYCAGALLFTLLFSLFGSWMLAHRATVALHALEDGTHEIGKGNLSYRLDIQTKDEFQTLAESMNKMCVELEEKERMKIGFAHYVSRGVLEKIMKEGPPKLGGERRKITVFFCDIRDFTKLAETLPAEEVMSLLNEYFQVMIDIVFKYNGLLDKLIGDAIMAEFGYPADDPEQERNAVLTALEMQSSLHILRSKWKQQNRPLLEMGVGIHSGEAIVGTIGSKDRMEFTAIGDTVNIASRLESATKTCNESIIVSESTFLALHNEFPHKYLGEIELKGKDQKIKAYAILPLK
jgi:adenylate cyclase